MPTTFAEQRALDTDERGPTVAARVIAPGLRRWASARVVRFDPSVWADVYARAKELGGEGGGGLMRGILDSIDILPLKAKTLVPQEALKSGRSDVARRRFSKSQCWTGRSREHSECAMPINEYGDGRPVSPI